MLGENTAEEFYIFYGSTTRNGKTTLLGTVQYLLGDYACSIKPESLAQAKDANGRTASGDIARLYGIRFLHCTEPPKRMKLNVELIKCLTGGDVITARHLYEMAADIIMGHLILADASKDANLFGKSARVYVNFIAAEIEKHASFVENLRPEDVINYRQVDNSIEEA